MDTPENRWTNFVKRFHSPKAMGMLVVVALVLSIPFTLSLVQKIQDVRQHAQQQNPIPGAVPVSQGSLTYPWQYTKATNTSLPVVTSAAKTLIGSRPFSAARCQRRSSGDADCNNTIDEGDLSFWQIDYAKHTTYFSDFDKDGKVTLADYNIWRVHAGIAPTPVIQKISEKIGISQILSQIFSGLLPSFQFRAYAQEATPTLTNSFLQLYADTYRILNQYTDGSYSVQFNEIKNAGGQMTYYDATGNQIMQISNYLEASATTTSQVNGNTVTITQNPDGALLQTIMDANGAFRAAQVWTSTASYQQGGFPQSVTLPIANGFTTVSLVPNNGAQVLNRDTNGNVMTYSALTDSTVSIYDYTNNSSTFSNSANGSTIYTIKNSLKGETTYTFSNLSVVSTKVTDNKGNSSIITAPLPGQFHIVTTDKAGNVTTQDSADPMTALGVDSLSPDTMTQNAQQYATTQQNTATSFSTGFSVNGQMPVQIAAVNRLLAIQNVQPAVLGASTNIQKEVLGEHVLLAVDANHNNTPSEAADAIVEAEKQLSIAQQNAGPHPDNNLTSQLNYAQTALNNARTSFNNGSVTGEAGYFSAAVNQANASTNTSRGAQSIEAKESLKNEEKTVAEDRRAQEITTGRQTQPGAPAQQTRPAPPAGAPASAPATQPQQTAQPQQPAAAQRAADINNEAVQQAEAQYTVHHKDGTTDFDGTRGERTSDAGLDYTTPERSVPSDWSPSEHGAGSPLDGNARGGGDVTHTDHPDQGQWGGSSGGGGLGKSADGASNTFGNGNNNSGGGGSAEGNAGGGNTNGTTTVTGAGPTNDSQGGGGGGGGLDIDQTIDSGNNNNDNNQGNSYNGE